MYQRSFRLLPLVKSCQQVPVLIQSRNVWDLMKPLDVRSTLRDMEREMERHFENFERNFFRNSPLRIITPRLMPIDGADSNKDSVYRVNIDVRGFKPEDIKISLKDKILKIEAHMDRAAEDGSRFQQSIVREFTLPSNIEQSSLKSLLHEGGILSIEASRNKEIEPKDIPIEHLDNGDKPKSKM